MKSQTSTQKILLYIFILFFVVSLSLINPLSPIHKNHILESDSAVFTYIGKAMAEYEQIPYRDIIDHKGPFLYLINFLGFKLAGFEGIWAIELLFLLVATFFSYKISQLFFTQVYINVSTAIITLLIYTKSITGGNFTESYAFPLILGALYFFLSYLFSSKTSLPKINILLIGVFLGLVVLLRPNMIGVWIAFFIVITFDLFISKKYKEIFLSIAFLLLGFLFATLPFILFFKFNGALDDFVFSYWTINTLYSKTTLENLLLVFHSLSTFSFFIILAIFIYPYFWIKYSIENNSKSFVFFGLFLSIIISIPFTGMAGKYFSYYLPIIIPLLVPCITLLLKYAYKKITLLQEKINKKQHFFANFAIISILFFGVFYIFSFYHTLKTELTFPEENLLLRNYVIANTSPDDKIINIGGGNNIYLTADRQAASKYIYQIPLVYLSPRDNHNSIEYKITNVPTDYINEDITRDFINDLETNQPKLIILTHPLQLGNFFDWEIKQYLEQKVAEGSYFIDMEYTNIINATIYVKAP